MFSHNTNMLFATMPHKQGTVIDDWSDHFHKHTFLPVYNILMKHQSVHKHIYLTFRFAECYNVLLEAKLSIHSILNFHLVMKAVLISIDLRLQLLLHVVDNNILRVSFEYLLKSTLSSSTSF